MKAIIYLMTLLSSTWNIAHGQISQSSEISYSIKCKYNLEYKPSIENEDRKNEVFLLLLNNTSSLFMSEKLYLRDSSFNIYNSSKSQVQRQAIASFTRNVFSDFNFRIDKLNCDNQTFYDRVYHTIYYYKEPTKKYKWDIKNDTTNINGFVCQKAELNSFGRKWIAWFSLDVPISDGPYKFCGLPGLIMSLKDEEANYVFTLQELLKVGTIYKIPKDEVVIPIDKKGFNKRLKAYKKNPIGVAEASGVVFTQGRNEVMKNVEKRIKEQNNSIELLK